MNTGSFIIGPTYTLNCGTNKNHNILSGSVLNQKGFSYNTTSRSLTISDWREFQDNTFYTLTFQLVLQNTQTFEQVSTTDSFFLVVGTVPIQYAPFGSKTYKYDDTFSIDYSSALDPQQPETGTLAVTWQCESFFSQCSTLAKTNVFDPINRITNRWAFGYDYKFNVTLQNRNTKFLKSSTDSFSVKINSPESSAQPLSCISFQLVFKNQTYPVNTISNTEQQIIFDNLNYTDIRIATPNVNIQNCATRFTNKQNYIAFTSFNNPDLFSDIRSYQFNTTDIVIPRNKIQSSLRSSGRQQMSFYVYLIDSVTNKISGFQYQKLTLQINDQSLYAIVTQNFIQNDRDKVLYIDGSTSYDARFNNVSYTYIWGIEGFPSLTFPNQRILTLTPDQRNSMGINQAGKYYNYTLKVADSTRISDTIKVLLQITPEADPNGCIKVSLKDIDIEKIVTYTIWPLILQAKVTRASCANMVIRSLVWECKSVDWQFWGLFGNNNTITMDRENLQKLPKNIDIQMSVTQYYLIKDIEYISRLTFTLFVEKPDLIPIVSYPRVINVREQTLILNATASYDPQAIATGTTNIPVVCSWSCPDYFKQICSKIAYQTNNCYAVFNSTEILTSTSYSTNIMNQAHLFTLTLSKDSRIKKAYIYVTIIDNNFFPRCQIDFIEDISINNYAFALANCSSNQASTFQYSWTAYQWDNFKLVDTINNYIPNQNQILRIPPYSLNQYKEILMVLTVTNKTQSTPIALYKEVNDKSQFTVGSINTNFNQFTAYLSTFTMTPANWDSTFSTQLMYQYRIKMDGNTLPTYRVLLSPTVSASNNPINIILPPFTYESQLYVDVIDFEQNFVTQQKGLISIADVKMTASSFSIRVNAIVQGGYINFQEAEFEQTILRLMLNFMAYKSDSLDLQGMPPSFFRTLSESTISYLYNMMIIDQRLNYVKTNDRATLIKQNTIELLSYIAAKQRNLTNTLDLFSILNLAVNSGRFYIGNILPDVVIETYSIIFQLSDMVYSPLTDTIIKRMQFVLQNFTFVDEKIYYVNKDYQFLFYETGATSANMPDLDGYTYPKGLFYLFTQQLGSLTFIRNSTFVHISIHDSRQNLISVTGLSQSVLISFSLSADQLAKNKSGNLTFFCATKDDFSKTWSTSRVSITSFNNQTGDVVCRVNQLGQTTLFINDLTLRPQNTTINTTIPSTEEQVIDGKWNSTIGPVPIDGYGNSNNADDIYIFDKEKEAFTAIAILTLLFFILSSVGFYYKFKDEHQVMAKNLGQEGFQIYPTSTLTHNRCQLFKLILFQFNPYLNLCLIYNKFLARWIRNSLLQLYFMTISLIYGINQTLLSQDKTEFGKSDSSQLIGLFIIVLIIVLLGRPWAIKLMYKLLYEPDSKVENYLITTEIQTEQQNKDKDLTADEKNQDKLVDFYEEFSSKKAPVIPVNILPKVFDNLQDTQYNPKSGRKLNYQKPVVEQFKVSIDDQAIEIPSSQIIYDAQAAQAKQEILIENNSINIRKSPLKGNKIAKNQFGSIKKSRQQSKQDQQQMDHILKHDQEEVKLSDRIEESVDHHKTFTALIDQSTKNDMQTQQDIQNQSTLPHINQKASMIQSSLIQQDPQSQSPPSLLPDINAKPHFYVTNDNSSQDINQIDRNFFEDFNALEEQANNPDNEQYEGGELDDVEEIQEKELHREDSLEHIQTLNYPTQHQTQNNRAVSEENMQNTEFLRDLPNFSDNKKQIKQGPFDRLFSSNIKQVEQSDSIRSDQVKDLEESGIMDNHKTLFINKIIGKICLLIIWIVLAIFNMICIQHMKEGDFQNWIILSLITFFCVIFIIDPLIYWILTIRMIASQQSRRAQYFTRYQNRRKCDQVFVVLLIGREKMKDLRRQLNPIITKQRN